MGHPLPVGRLLNGWPIKWIWMHPHLRKMILKKLRTVRFPIKEYGRIKLVTQIPFLHSWIRKLAWLSINTYILRMVGVGKLLKQAQKMQQKMEEAQASLSEEILEVTGGGGAVSIKISGMGEFKDIKLDPDF